MNKNLINAYKEIGGEEFNKYHDVVFGKEVLNYAKSMVINLPSSCYCNCKYCIDNKIKNDIINEDDFLNRCEYVFNEIKDIKEVSITGGTLKPKYFNKLIAMIKKYYNGCIISWNTNGVNITKEYEVGCIDYINLHRQYIDDDKNRESLVTRCNILTIDEAKNMFGDKLYLRATVLEDFNLKEFLGTGINLYLNRVIGGTKEDERVFDNILSKLKIDKNDVRRRNKYLNCNLDGRKIRLALGDKDAKRVPGRYPTFLNVVIIHRNGKVCGSWYYDDKLLLN